MAAAAAPRRWREPSVLPGFNLALGWTLSWLGLIVLLPLAALVVQAAGIGLSGFVGLLRDPRVTSALGVSFGLAFLAAIVASVFGLLVAWVLTRYDFPGRRIIDAIVDLPFALPTAVAGIALASLYAPNGLVGRPLAIFGIDLAYSRAGILVAMIFIALPFAVRTVQPLIAEIDPEVEEAAATLGAPRRWALRTVVLPPLVPAVLTGFALAFARCVGEYGSIIFIAGNMPYKTEIAPLLIVIKLSEFDYPAASAVAVMMLAASFASLLAINLLQAWSRTRFGYV